MKHDKGRPSWPPFLLSAFVLRRYRSFRACREQAASLRYGHLQRRSPSPRWGGVGVGGADKRCCLGPWSNRHYGKRCARILIVAVEAPWIPALNAGMTLKGCENAISVAVVVENTTVIPGLDPGIQGSTGPGFNGARHAPICVFDSPPTSLPHFLSLHPTPCPSPSRGGDLGKSSTS